MNAILDTIIAEKWVADGRRMVSLPHPDEPGKRVVGYVVDQPDGHLILPNSMLDAIATLRAPVNAPAGDGTPSITLRSPIANDYSTPAAAPAPVDGMVLDALQKCHDALMKFAGDPFDSEPPWEALTNALNAAQDALAAPTSAPTPDRATPGERDALHAAVKWARDEFADKEHVWRCRNDIGMADYLKGCKERMDAALTPPIASSEVAHGSVTDAMVERAIEAMRDSHGFLNPPTYMRAALTAAIQPEGPRAGGEA